eukprot:15478803-Alexandrium_andersonii.AAC.1
MGRVCGAVEAPRQPARRRLLAAQCGSNSYTDVAFNSVPIYEATRGGNLARPRRKWLVASLAVAHSCT